MSPRPPSDGVVALRSLPRRFRAAFAGLGEDESPDALAVRPAADGTSALGHVAAASAALAATAQALQQVLADDDALVSPLPQPVGGTPAGTVEERVSEVGWEAEALADRVEHVSADEWARVATVAGGSGTRVSAADVFWQGVDAAVDQLKAAERTLAEVRQSR
jgi:hypothetical protein